MALSEGDRAIIREIAFEAAKTIGAEMEKTLCDRLALAQATCPLRQEFEAVRNQAKGGWKTLALVAAVVTGSISLAISIMHVAQMIRPT